jgi:glycerol-3-phosphate dehydrogenase
MTRGDKENPYDVVIIGGGINGCGIARDCVMRGLTVALFEKNDFSTGATWASSGMIHGGLRYLKKDPEVTRLACVDSGYIQKIAPHLLFRIPFLMPFREGEKWPRTTLELADVYFKTYDQYAPFKGGLPHSRLLKEEVYALEPGIRRDVIGAVTTDEWGIDAARLTSINALDAARRGADVHNYVEVEGLLRAGEEILGARVRDRLTGSRREVYGRVTFNAAGAWATRFAVSQGVHGVQVRPGKGIHLIYPGRLTNYAIVCYAIDGREIFICPHQNSTLVGTTDDDYYGDLDNIPILHDEVEYLIQGVASVFPSIRDYRVMDTTVGCRPTLHQYGPNESALSREHEIYDHGREGARNFLSMAGGKLASYRVMSEEATDQIVRALGRRVEELPCRTHAEPLPGGAAHDLKPDAFIELGLDGYTAQRIIYRHGSEAHRILEMMREEPRLRRHIDPSEPVTEAELRYVIRHEQVKTLEDCKRRARLGCGPDQGARVALLAAQIFAQERGLAVSDVPEIALHFQAMRYRDRGGILRGQQLQQEDLALGWLLEATGLGQRRGHFVMSGAASKAPQVAPVAAQR